MRPIAVLAIAVLAAFFMPWATVPDPKGSGVQASMTGLDIARAISESKEMREKTQMPAAVFGVRTDFYLWALPVLAIATLLSAGKGVFGRLSGLLTGAYPLAWIGYGIFQIPSDKRGAALKSLGDHIFQYLGVGAYVLLLGSVLLIIFSLVGIGTSTQQEED